MRLVVAVMSHLPTNLPRQIPEFLIAKQAVDKVDNLVTPMALLTSAPAKVAREVSFSTDAG